MKNTVITIFIVAALVLSLPCNHCLAYSQSELVLHTRDSVSGFASGTYQEYLDAVYIPSFSLDFYDIIGRLPSDDPIFSFDHFIVFGTNNSLGIFGFNSPDNSNVGMLYCDWYPDSNYGSDGYYIKVPSNANISNYGCYMYNNNAQVWAPNTSAFSVFQEGGNFFYIASQYKYYVFDTDLFITVDKQGTMSQLFPNGYQNFDNMNPEGLPYEDSNGNIVSPVEYESNSNHMYFQSCDLGFCEPTGITNFESFGGAYLYCKYTVDNWIVNHINDYQLRFNVVSVIGSEQNNFSYTMRLDRNGYVTVPFSSLFVSNSSSAIPVNHGFAAVVSPQKLNNDYNIAHLYSVANENVPNFVSEILDAEYDYNLTDLGWSALRGGTLKYIVAWVSDHGTKSLNNTANWAESITQSFNPYILRVEVKLIAGEDQSSGYAEKFDLYTGDQSTVDTGGLVNPDPFVPDVNQDDGDLPSAPQDPNSTSPSPIVYTGGVWQGTLNGVIGYDPGYLDLKADIDKDPDGNFTQYLDPMKNQTVGSWFLSFVNDMPAEMKALLITGTGVGIFFGIYRFIRRG